MSKALLGGLLSGLGKGMAEDYEQMRKEALERARMTREDARWKQEQLIRANEAEIRDMDREEDRKDQKDREQRQEGAADRRQRDGFAHAERMEKERAKREKAERDARATEDRTKQAATKYTNAKGQTVLRNEYGNEVVLDGSEKGKSGLSTEDNNLLKRLENIHGTRDEYDPTKIVSIDRNAIAESLRKLKRPDLAEIYEDNGGLMRSAGQQPAGSVKLTIGQVVGDYKFLGGDPKDTESWEAIK